MLRVTVQYKEEDVWGETAYVPVIVDVDPETAGEPIPEEEKLVARSGGDHTKPRAKRGKKRPRILSWRSWSSDSNEIAQS